MRILLDEFNKAFEKLHTQSCGLAKCLSCEMLYQEPLGGQSSLFPLNSPGINLIRSAAVIEQMAGGITARLWDDPFEWTLPENLKSPELLISYLEEAEAARKNCFSFISADRELIREMPAPEKLETIFSVLTNAHARAENFQGRAINSYQLLTGRKFSQRA